MSILVLHTKEIGNLFRRSVILYTDAFYNECKDILHDEIYEVSTCKDPYGTIGDIQ